MVGGPRRCRRVAERPCQGHSAVAAVVGIATGAITCVASRGSVRIQGLNHQTSTRIHPVRLLTDDALCRVWRTSSSAVAQPGSTRLSKPNLSQPARNTVTSRNAATPAASGGGWLPAHNQTGTPASTSDRPQSSRHPTAASLERRPLQGRHSSWHQSVLLRPRRITTLPLRIALVWPDKMGGNPHSQVLDAHTD